LKKKKKLPHQLHFPTSTWRQQRSPGVLWRLARAGSATEAVRERFSSRGLACRSYGGEANVELIGNLPRNGDDGLGFRLIWQRKRAG
jgi:hypothetical protein